MREQKKIKLKVGGLRLFRCLELLVKVFGQGKGAGQVYLQRFLKKVQLLSVQLPGGGLEPPRLGSQVKSLNQCLVNPDLREQKKIKILWLAKEHKYNKNADHYCYLRTQKAKTRKAQLFWINAHYLYGEILAEGRVIK